MIDYKFALQFFSLFVTQCETKLDSCNKQRIRLRLTRNFQSSRLNSPNYLILTTLTERNTFVDKCCLENCNV